jgi:hypothetical protein
LQGRLARLDLRARLEQQEQLVRLDLLGQSA